MPASNLPRHVAIIPDGNRRWAKVHGLSTYQGHQSGFSIMKDLVHHAADRGISHLSFWGLSVDNLLKRHPIEVTGLLKIFHHEFTRLKDDPEIHSRGIRIQALGEWRQRFPAPVRRAIHAAEEATKTYHNYFLNVFLAYTGLREMTQAVTQITKTGATRITPKLIKQHLYTKDLPPVDLLIRTGGEPHNSAGFMMWDTADSQLYFTSLYWPDFTIDEFDRALVDYAERPRRFGS
jgi:undecaprenyl diphosphate synthase